MTAWPDPGTGAFIRTHYARVHAPGADHLNLGVGIGGVIKATEAHSTSVSVEKSEVFDCLNIVAQPLRNKTALD